MSTPVARPEALVTVPGIVELKPDDGSASLDAARVPYASAVLTVPFVDLDTLELLDPRDGLRVITEAGDSETGTSRTFDLGLRERSVDHKARTVTLRLSGDESLLMDYAPLAPDTGARAHEASLRAVCNYVLGKIGATLEAGAADADVTAYWPLTNLVPNSRAESTTGFLAGPNTSTVGIDTTTGGYSGPNFVYWRATAAGISDLLLPVGASARGGEAYTASAYVMADSVGRPIRMIMHATDTAGEIIQQFTGALVNTTSVNWARRISVTGVMPEGTAKINLVMEQITTGANAAGVDGIMLTPGSELVPFFMGGSTGGGYTYAWTGPADASTSTRTPDVERLPDLFVWPPGVSAWDFLEPLTAVGGRRLFCDETRAWRLVDPATYTTPGVLALQPRSVADGQDTIALGDPEIYATGVVVRYRWEANGTQLERTDAAGVPGLVRVIDINRPYPGPGLAAAVLSRMAGRGRVQDVIALADWTASPGMAATVTLPGTVDQAGEVRSIEWGLADGLMQVKTSALIDIIPGSIDALTGTIDALTGTIDSL